VIAASYLFFYLAVCVSVAFVLYLRFKENPKVDMSTEYPQYQTLFENLRTTKSAQSHIIVFLVRRTLFACALIFIDVKLL